MDVRVKLNLVPNLVEGKRIIIVDDSIVRGTTSQSRIKILKEAGAKEVHVLIGCPPHKHSCVYGIDFPDRKKLLAATATHEEICRHLGADSVGYLSEEGMVEATHQPKDHFAWLATTEIIPLLTMRMSIRKSLNGEAWNRSASVNCSIRKLRSQSSSKTLSFKKCIFPAFMASLFVLETTLFGNKKWSSQVQI